jgi:hypothetical protein
VNYLDQRFSLGSSFKSAKSQTQTVVQKGVVQTVVQKGVVAMTAGLPNFTPSKIACIVCGGSHSSDACFHTQNMVTDEKHGI